MALVLYTIPPENNFSRNPIRFKVGTDTPVTTVGLYIQCRLSFATKGSTLAEVIRFPLTPDANGLAEVDMQRLVDRMMEYQLPTIDATVQKIATHTGTMQVHFVEYSVDVPNGGTPVDAGTFNVVKGGIAYEKWTGQAYFANWYTTPRRLLTWFGLERTVSTWQHLWLSYLHLAASDTGYAVKTTVYFTDGTSTAGPTIDFPATGAVTEGYVYHIPAGYTQLDMGSVDIDKRVHYYNVGVYEGVTLVSEMLTCLMDYTPDYEMLQFVFFNSLGGLDVIRLKGEQQQQLNREFDLVDINTSRSNIGGYTLPAQSGQNQVLEGRSFKGNIGWTDDIDLQDLRRELFLSPAIYMPYGTRWRPVNVTDKTVNLGKLNDQLRELDIEWSYAWVNENYTPEWVSLGNEPDPVVSCPVITLTPTNNNIAFSFPHAPGPINRYVVRLYDSLDVQVGADKVFNLPFGSPIGSSFSGLTAETQYKVKVFMQVVETGFEEECGPELVTTLEDVDPGTLDAIIQVEVVSNSGQPFPVITGISYLDIGLALTPPDVFPLDYTNGIASGPCQIGSGELVISYQDANYNTLTATDSNGNVFTTTIHNSGFVTFSPFAIDDNVIAIIQIT
jgi:hypothetical protein